ncbi:S16 family serine protease [Microbacterium album]|uniref:endopeptidase La n=1 Tax=Microbacterium album TaxID=2053191 RepID=A0A917ML20_9MICO|nr:S16 family serine protease [Microbacterium album]GGH39841.1 hypothetical protein GCM10010921_11340 [Microbacterium album]
MNRRPPSRMLCGITLLVSALVLSACSGAGGAQDESRSLSVHWLAYSGDGGSVGETRLTRTPSEDGDFRVEFSENEVGGIGEASQAAAWNAAIVSTLLTGGELSGAYRFETDGRIDGPSAGALTTAGLIALHRGDELLEGVTMTGTINPTGTIGPVGGIPEKLQGAADAEFTKVLVPLGQRNVPDVEGREVDVVREGERLGIEVVEVSDVYEAYEHLTGEVLRPPSSSAQPRLDNASYAKVEAQTGAVLARYEEAMRGFSRAPRPFQDMFLVEGGLVQEVETRAQKARDLQRQGQQAGAYIAAGEAAALAATLEAGANLLNPVFTQGFDGLGLVFADALDIGPSVAKVESFLDQLAGYQPKTIADVEGLVNAYAGTFDAYSLLIFATGRIEAIQQRFEGGGYGSLEELFTELVQPVLYAQLAEAQLAVTQSSFEIGRDNPGASISEDVDVHAVGAFFRRGADANFKAFEEAFVTPQAEAAGMSNAQLLDLLSNVDLTVAAARTQPGIEAFVSRYIGEDSTNAAYATLGYGLNNYVRNAMLVDKYYNNAILDSAFTVTGVRWDAVLNHAIDLGRDHLSSEIALLRDHDTEPVLAVGGYESAVLSASGDVASRFGAVSSLNGGFVTARVLSYLGGFPASLAAD